jgi:2-keto-4-pentenoate hydratase/2-oxohepta-3-ene-1,7-dioic acid hydratase in catechol pathway
MKLYTVRDSGGDWAAAERDGGLVDLTAAGAASTILDLVRAGAEGLRAAAKARALRCKLEEAKLAPPIRPGKVLCSGINYRGHADENPNAKMPSEPFFFAKLPSAVAGMDAPIVHPKLTGQLDYEVEFAVVMGKRLSRAAEADVMPAIFGYTLLNDVSARDVQFKDNQITLGKNFDGFAPLGPCIVTADALPRPDQVRLRTRLNGKTLQDGSTSDWLFPLPRLISFLSHVMTLEPGDVISTGTPAGVGLFRKPPLFMKPGDVVEIEAEGIGVLRNPIVAG